MPPLPLLLLRMVEFPRLLWRIIAFLTFLRMIDERPWPTSISMFYRTYHETITRELSAHSRISCPRPAKSMAENEKRKYRLLARSLRRRTLLVLHFIPSSLRAPFRWPMRSRLCISKPSQLCVHSRSAAERYSDRIRQASEFAISFCELQPRAR